MDLPENALSNQRREGEASSDNNTFRSGIKPPAQTSNASFRSDQSHIDEISVRHQRAGVYTNSAEALNRVAPELVNSLQRSGLLQLPSVATSLLSTNNLNIRRLTTEEIDANIIIDVKPTSPAVVSPQNAQPTMVYQQHHINAGIAVLIPPKSEVKIAELTNQLKQYYKLYDNTIKRIFGLPLALDKCFVNLAIVKNDEQKKYENDKLKSYEDRAQIYLSYEDIYSTDRKEVILPQNLFNEHKNKIPKRIVVIGRAGIGKSILSQYLSAFLWAAQNVWQDKFDVVIKIQLRNLTKDRYNKNPSLADIINIECTDSSGITSKLDTAEIEATLKAISSRTLVILDGWDEFNLTESPCAKTILDLMKNPSVSIIVSSRPYTNINKNDFDLILECIGFTTENIPEYINRVCEDKTQAPLIIAFLKRNPAIHSLAHVPIILDMICAIWDEEMNSCTEPMTMTELYNKMLAKLWKAYMKKQEEMNPGIAEEKVRQKKEKAKELLSLLAFMAMEKNSILISYQQIEKAIKEIYQCDDEDVENKLKELLQTGLLYTSNIKNVRSEYYFPHLTFQEYFAALHWIKLFTTKSFEVKENSRKYLIEHKYNPKFEVVWWFVSGTLFLQGNHHALAEYFDLFMCEPRDLLGLSHYLLLMRCFDEIKMSHVETKNSVDLLNQLNIWLTRATHHGLRGSLQPVFTHLRYSPFVLSAEGNFLVKSLHSTLLDASLHEFEKSYAVREIGELKDIFSIKQAQEVTDFLIQMMNDESQKNVPYSEIIQVIGSVGSKLPLKKVLDLLMFTLNILKMHPSAFMLSAGAAIAIKKMSAALSNQYLEPFLDANIKPLILNHETHKDLLFNLIHYVKDIGEIFPCRSSFSLTLLLDLIKHPHIDGYTKLTAAKVFGELCSRLTQQDISKYLNEIERLLDDESANKDIQLSLGIICNIIIKKLSVAIQKDLVKSLIELFQDLLLDRDFMRKFAYVIGDFGKELCMFKSAMNDNQIDQLATCFIFILKDSKISNHGKGSAAGGLHELCDHLSPAKIDEAILNLLLVLKNQAAMGNITSNETTFALGALGQKIAYDKLTILIDELLLLMLDSNTDPSAKGIIADALSYLGNKCSLGKRLAIINILISIMHEQEFNDSSLGYFIRLLEIMCNNLPKIDLITVCYSLSNYFTAPPPDAHNKGCIGYLLAKLCIKLPTNISNNIIPKLIEQIQNIQKYSSHLRSSSHDEDIFKMLGHFNLINYTQLIDIKQESNISDLFSATPLHTLFDKYFITRDFNILKVICCKSLSIHTPIYIDNNDNICLYEDARLLRIPLPPQFRDKFQIDIKNAVLVITNSNKLSTSTSLNLKSKDTDIKPPSYSLVN